MKTLTPHQVGPFVESLLSETSGGGDILITRNGEAVARLERPGQEPTSIKEQFAELRRRRSGIQIDTATLKQWRDEGRR